MLHQNKLLKLLAVPVLAVGTLIATAPAQTAAAKDVTYLLPAPGFLPAFAGCGWGVGGSTTYKAEGLNVKFQTARGGVDVAKQVGAGNAVVGGGLGDTPIIVRPNGIPVKAVAVLGGRSLMQLVTRNDRGIKSLKDLKGKTITSISLQDTTYYALLGMLATAGLTKNDVKAQAAGPVGVWKLFLAGKSDAMAAVPDWIGIARGAKVKLTIWPADDHFKSMAQAILAADKTIKENPQLIGKLVRATLKGLKDIMKDSDGVIADYIKHVPKNKGKEKYLSGVFKLYNKYVYPGQKTVGEMDRARLKALQEFYVGQGVLRKSSKLDDLYTNQFVN